MKKLIAIGFILVFFMISLCSFLDFFNRSNELMLSNKKIVDIEYENKNLSARELSALVGNKFKEQKIDIMLRKVQKRYDNEYIYKYYKTDYNPDFVDVLGTSPKEGEYIATVSLETITDPRFVDIKPKGMLDFGDIFAADSPPGNIAVFHYSEAEKENIRNYDIHIPKDKVNEVQKIFQDSNIQVRIANDSEGVTIGGGYRSPHSDKYMSMPWGSSMLLTISLTYLAVIAYIALKSKPYKFLSIEGFSSKNIILREIRTVGLIGLIPFVITWGYWLILAKIEFNKVFFDIYFAFIQKHIILGLSVILGAFLILSISISCLKNAACVKNKVQHDVAYAATVIFRVFTSFIAISAFSLVLHLFIDRIVLRSFIDRNLKILSGTGLFTITVLLSLFFIAALFSIRLYIENHEEKILCALIEGIPLKKCIKSHLKCMAITYIVLTALLAFITFCVKGMLLFVVAGLFVFFADLKITLALCARHFKKTLNRSGI